jgi:glyoxylase-like metal-dependent hydrolase (beta-lactamase superfamily II)
MDKKIILRQNYDLESGTFTYIVADKESKEAIIIDSVKNNVERDLKVIKELGLNLLYIFDTHVHADHITGAFELKNQTDAKIVIGENNNSVKNVDIYIKDNEEIQIGNFKIKAIMTPGHTDGCTSYNISNMLFTGDTLLIRSTGRTDFQQGNSKQLFQSINKLYEFADDTIIFPAHNYQGLSQSSILEEKQYNQFIKKDTSESEFIESMNNRELPLPKKIKVALPLNLKSGEE